MLVTFALVVFSSAIVIVFSQEFTSLFKAVFAYKTTQILIPLFAASWLVYSYDYWILWGVYYCQQILSSTVLFFSELLSPYSIKSSMIVIVVLTLTSVLPVFILNIIWKKRTLRVYPYPYITSTMIWIISALLWLVNEGIS